MQERGRENLAALLRVQWADAQGWVHVRVVCLEVVVDCNAKDATLFAVEAELP